MSNYEKLTASPEALGAFLSSLPVASAPWDDEFHERVCSSCPAADCDDCRREERANPLWWLGQEARA